MTLNEALEAYTTALINRADTESIRQATVNLEAAILANTSAGSPALTPMPAILVDPANPNI